MYSVAMTSGGQVKKCRRVGCQGGTCWWLAVTREMEKSNKLNGQLGGPVVYGETNFFQARTIAKRYNCRYLPGQPDQSERGGKLETS